MAPVGGKGDMPQHVHVIRMMEFDRSRAGEPAAATGVPQFLIKSIEHVEGFGGRNPKAVDRGGTSVVPIGQVRGKIKREKPPEVAAEITVEGTFFPAVLLCSGWWERRKGVALAQSIEWRNDLQHWLFSGFEQWGPSWDVNPVNESEEHYLIGQIGEGDEADSLPVIIAGSKAADIREQLARGIQAFSIRAKGFLCHRRNITDVGLQRRIQQWGKSFDFCLMVKENEPEHFASPRPGAPELYSGYLWQCWLPESYARFVDETVGGAATLEPPRLTDVYFLWEHTNLTKPGAVDYNLDSLRNKVKFLRKEHGDLILVQKSSNLIEGEQALSRDDFYRFVMPTPAARDGAMPKDG
jgi:hypothetical protein